MEISIDWPIGRSDIDLHHWKHFSLAHSEENKNQLNKRCECAIKTIHVEQRKCAFTKKSRKKNKNMVGIWNRLNEIECAHVWTRQEENPPPHNPPCDLPQWKHFTSIRFKSRPQIQSRFEWQASNNHLFICMTVPLKCLIQPQTGVTGRFTPLPVCTSRMSLLNPLTGADRPGLFLVHLRSSWRSWKIPSLYHPPITQLARLCCRLRLCVAIKTPTFAKIIRKRKKKRGAETFGARHH